MKLAFTGSSHVVHRVRARDLDAPSVLSPLSARVALLAATAALLSSGTTARASIAPATAIDGPSAAILGVDGVAMSEDGTGGMVYRKRVDGRVNVYVSRFTARGWQPPQRVDAGQRFTSSWPAIGAGDGGRLVVTWVHEFGGAVQNRMFSAVLGPGATRFQAPVALDLDVREGLDATVMTALDSIAWTFNVRGTDVTHTPVGLAFALLHADATADLFIAPDKIDDAVRAHLGNGVRLHDRDAFAPMLATLSSKRVAADPERAVAAVFDAVHARLRDALDHLLDEHGLSDSRATEEADLAAQHVGREEVDDLDAGLEELGLRLELVEGRGLAMDRPALGDLESLAVDGAVSIRVENLADDVEDLALGDVADRHGDGRSGVAYLLAAY